MELREAFWASTLLALALACGTSSGTHTPGANGSGAMGGPSAGGAATTVNAASSDTSTAQGGTSPASAVSSSGGTSAATSGSSGGAAGETSAGGASTTTTTTGAPPIDCRDDGDGRTTLVFVNRCAASVTLRGSDIEDANLLSGAFVCVDIGSATEELPSKRYWGFTGDDPGAEHHTLAEFTFNTDFNDFDWYNISHVDAFNLPMQIVPVDRSDCATLACPDDLLAGCPAEGRFEHDGELVACVSPNRDDGESPVALYFESCDDAYAWSGDDQNGDDPSPVRACAGEDWDIVFCPGGAE